MTERKGRKGTIDGQFLKRALLGGLAPLNAHHEDVNRINVFPVPDGDTGTNMLLTLQAAVEDIRESQETDISKVARNAAHRSMMGLAATPESSCRRSFGALPAPWSAGPNLLLTN